MKLPHDVTDAILDVIESELRPFPIRGDDDEGAIPEEMRLRLGLAADDGWRWRRGITRANRARLDAGAFVGAGTEAACEYVIIYRVPPMPGFDVNRRLGQPEFIVHRVLSNHEHLAPAVSRLVADLLMQHQRNRSAG